MKRPQVEDGRRLYSTCCTACCWWLYTVLVALVTMGDSAAPDWGQWAQTAPTNVIPSGFVLPQRGGAPPSQGAGLLVAGPGARNQGQELCFQEFGTPNTETNTQSGVLMAAQGVQSPPSWFKTLKIKKGTKTKRCKNQWPPPPWKWGLETQKAPKKVKFLSPSPLQRQPCKREIRKAKIQGKIPPRNFQAGIF